MKYTTIGYKALAVSAALTLALVGCGGANEATTKTTEKAEEKTEQVEQADQNVATTDWKTASTAEDAAKGAGFKTFALPATITLGTITFEKPAYAYADGVAQATYESPATMLVIRKADGTHTAPMTDREKGDFTNKWTSNIAGLDVTLYGATNGAATVMTWTDGTKDYGVTFQGLGGDEMSMTAQESETLVKGIKDAEAATTDSSASSNASTDNGTKATEEKKSDDNSATANTSSNTDASSSEQASTTDSSSTNGMEAQFSKDQCIYNATSSTGAGDAATNLTCSELIDGGGTLYYIVEYDLTGSHYRVMVDATNGGIIDVMESVDGEVINYADAEGEVVTEEQAESDGMQVNFSKDQCIYNATSSTGAGDAATNLTCSELIDGGGTLYYIVEYDLTGSHYRVMVDATNGGIIDVMESVDGEVINY